MKIAHSFKAIIVVLFFAVALPSTSTAIAATPTLTVPVSDSAHDARVLSKIVLRVTEIQNMDKSNLSPAEKKELRKELRDMKTTADGLNRGVYLSVGAIIIIILVLILILN